MNKVIAGIVILIVLAGGAFFVASNNNDNSKSSASTSNSTSQQPSNSSSNSESTKPAAATISYDGSTFSPSNVTVKSGDTVEIKNTSSTDLQFDSNPHPVHTDDTDLNVGVVVAGASKTFTVTKTGSFGYHNHLDPTQKGQIVVQ